MEITVKNVKINNSKSQETLYFTADIYVNGTKAGYADNDGWGGATNVRIVDKVLWEKVDTHFKSIPPRNVDMDGFILENFQEDLESHVDNLVYKIQEEKEVAKFAKKELKLVNENKAKGFPVTFKVQKANHYAYIGSRSEDMTAIMVKEKVSADKITILK